MNRRVGFVALVSSVSLLACTGDPVSDPDSVSDLEATLTAGTVYFDSVPDQEIVIKASAVYTNHGTAAGSVSVIGVTVTFPAGDWTLMHIMPDVSPLSGGGMVAPGETVHVEHEGGIFGDDTPWNLSDCDDEPATLPLHITVELDGAPETLTTDAAYICVS